MVIKCHINGEPKQILLTSKGNHCQPHWRVRFAEFFFSFEHLHKSENSHSYQLSTYKSFHSSLVIIIVIFKCEQVESKEIERRHTFLVLLTSYITPLENSNIFFSQYFQHLNKISLIFPLSIRAARKQFFLTTFKSKVAHFLFSRKPHARITPYI